MDKKTAGIIGLVAAIVLCGLPGLCGFCFGPFFAVVGMIPGADIDVFGSSDPSSAIGYGIGIFCVSIFLVAIPVLVWYFTLRKKPAADEVVEYNETLPDEDF